MTEYTELEGDFTEGLPEQPDPVTYVFNMKPNVAFHDKAPMNGRLATAQDFLATYERFLAQSANSARFADVIDAVDAPDQSTIRFRLKAPDAAFLVNKAASEQALWFIPAETIDNGQVQTDPVGTGPWVLRQYTPGVRFRWERHTGYYDSPMPYFDAIEWGTGNDPQRNMNALEAGDFDYGGVNAASVPEIATRLDQDGQVISSRHGSIYACMFDFNNQPWHDKRVRQALSMTIDRAGLQTAVDPSGDDAWDSFVGSGLIPHYVSPNDARNFGSASAYFQHDLGEARKLLDAAGVSGKLDVNVTANVDRYGPAAQQYWELGAAMMNQGAFNAQNVYQEYGAFSQTALLGRHPNDPKAITMSPMTSFIFDPDDLFMTSYWSGSSRHSWSGPAIPEQAKLDEMYLKQRTILDTDERVEYVREIQKVMGESFLVVPLIRAAAVVYVQPWVRNAYYKATNAVVHDTFQKAYFTDERIARG